jgi:hypothetical protein
LLLSPLGERQSPSFEQFRIPSAQGWFVPSLVKIGPVVLEKKSKMSKFTDGQTDRRTTDKRRSEKLTWAFSSGELKNVIDPSRHLTRDCLDQSRHILQVYIYFLGDYSVENWWNKNPPLLEYHLSLYPPQRS